MSRRFTHSMAKSLGNGLRAVSPATRDHPHDQAEFAWPARARVPIHSFSLTSQMVETCVHEPHQELQDLYRLPRHVLWFHSSTPSRKAPRLSALPQERC